MYIINKNRQGMRKLAGRLIVWAGALLILSACGLAKEDGMAGENSSEEMSKDADVITVEVRIESDGDSANRFEADINAKKNPESVYLESIEVPFSEKFMIPKDVFIPLTSTRVEAEAVEGASWISCTILYDGEVVATHKSRGNGAKAVCEKKIRLGPG